MNYVELVDAIQDYAETRELSFVANIPLFVRQAEQRVYRTVMLPELRKVGTLPLVAGSQTVDRPTDFLSVFSFAVVDAQGDYFFLYDKDPSFIREAYPNASTTGRPRVYAQLDGDAGATPSGRFIVAPTPDANYDIELQYYYDPPSIVDAGTSWLGDNAETVLLYGTLVEAYTYLKGDPDLMAQYTQRYQEALTLLSGVDIRSKRDDYRDGQLRGGG
jgi:hypothetical protein